jgi:hypothetical protein
MRVPLYKCEICDIALDPKDATVLRLITGWVKGNGAAIKFTETNHYRYIHEFCRSPKDENQLELF